MCTSSTLNASCISAAFWLRYTTTIVSAMLWRCMHMTIVHSCFSYSPTRGPYTAATLNVYDIAYMCEFRIGLNRIEIHWKTSKKRPKNDRREFEFAPNSVQYSQRLNKFVFVFHSQYLPVLLHMHCTPTFLAMIIFTLRVFVERSIVGCSTACL